MRDFVHDRKKNLDLVLCTPSGARGEFSIQTLQRMAEEWGIDLTETERAELVALPELRRAPVASVLMALAGC